MAAVFQERCAPLAKTQFWLQQSRRTEIKISPTNISDRSTVAGGAFITKLIALVLLRGGRKENYHKKASQNKVGGASSHTKRGKCATTPQLLFISILFPFQAKIRRYPSWPPACSLRISLWSTQYVRRLHPVLHKSKAKEPISSLPS